jgi:protein-tyrosine-phosphatase
MESKINAVLFACERNSVRSPMAEAWLKHFHGRTIYVDSCGLKDGDIDPFAAEVMREIGLDLSRHESKTFDDLDDGFFDLVITLSPEAQHRAVEMTRDSAVIIEYWQTADATAENGSREQRLSAYRAVRDALRERILARFPLPGSVVP